MIWYSLVGSVREVLSQGKVKGKDQGKIRELRKGKIGKIQGLKNVRETKGQGKLRENQGLGCSGM